MLFCELNLAQLSDEPSDALIRYSNWTSWIVIQYKKQHAHITGTSWIVLNKVVFGKEQIHCGVPKWFVDYCFLASSLELRSSQFFWSRKWPNLDRGAFRISRLELIEYSKTRVLATCQSQGVHCPKADLLYNLFQSKWGHNLQNEHQTEL